MSQKPTDESNAAAGAPTADSTLRCECPDCGAELVLDRVTGRILLHKSAEAPLAGGKDFDSLLSDIDASKARASAVFDREFSALKDKDRLLEQKFQEALRRAEEEDDGEPPVRPWDLD